MSYFSNRRRLYQNHPDVKFVPGPFYMGDGWLGWTCNVICIAWTLFVSVLFSLPTYFPVTAENMNYASVITVGVITLSLYVPPPLSPSPGALTTVVRSKQALVFLWVCYPLSSDGNFSQPLTEPTEQGCTIKVPYHIQMDTAGLPGGPRSSRRTSPKSTT